MKLKYVYWISTAILCGLYLMSATFYITQGSVVRPMFTHLGFPTYLVTVLEIAKPLAVVAVLSRVKVPLSDLAYAGMFYHLLLAVSAHFNAQEVGAAAPALVGLVALLVSFFTQNAARRTPSPNAPALAPAMA